MTYSVIVPIFNEEERLINLLENFTSEFNENDEIILVNDFSTDGSASIILEWISNWSEKIDIRYIENESNMGVSYSRNVGIRAAKKDYILFLDADDTIVSDFKSKIERYVSLYGEIDLVRFNHNLSDMRGFEAKVFNAFESIPDEFIKSYYLHSSCTQIARRSLFEDVLYDESLVFGEDMLLVYQLIKKATSILVLPDVLYIYNFSTSSATNSMTPEQILKRIQSTVKFYDSILCEPSKFSQIYQNKKLREMGQQLMKLRIVDKFSYSKALNSYMSDFTGKWHNNGEKMDIFERFASSLSQNRMYVASMYALIYKIIKAAR
ncbi:glycosyltransferase family 2 protein [Erysipelothrix sp. HDW6B]|uniref:glycosyltransferase family 2 protein n=1 Tax=Erysipelothrix sp. HDW6B TaxID=2714929 RepID=UPI00140D7547|nr:glycosyltransferase family 2 protein [Erysipelothrix sp. HDW6B]QIK86859.1 glycosyltransferase family 2 protein [Erysipelothrix sp. HDW6B]